MRALARCVFADWTEPSYRQAGTCERKRHLQWALKDGFAGMTPINKRALVRMVRVRAGDGKTETRKTRLYRSELRYKVAIRFAIEGDLRFISHHDTMRLFERALARARLPVVFSEGFNPRPKLTLPLPRPVGMATADDLLVVRLGERLLPEEVVRRLAEQMPEGVRLGDAWELPPGASVQPDQVRYEVAVPDECAAAVTEAAKRLMASAHWPIHRSGRPCGKRRSDEKIIDLRAFLSDVSVENGTLAWTVRVTPDGSARPAEVLEAVGLDPDRWRHRVRRVRVVWRTGAPAITNPQAESGPAARSGESVERPEEPGGA